MCCHRFWVYMTCGHSVFAPTPTVLCQEAAIPPRGSFSTSCALKSHPFQSWKVDSLCPDCDKRRGELLTRIEARQKIHYDEWRWKVSYGMPAHGKDIWGKKADERAQLEQETGKRQRRSLLFSWKRSKKQRKSLEGDVPKKMARSVTVT